MTDREVGGRARARRAGLGVPVDLGRVPRAVPERQEHVARGRRARRGHWRHYDGQQWCQHHDDGEREDRGYNAVGRMIDPEVDARESQHDDH